MKTRLLFILIVTSFFSFSQDTIVPNLAQIRTQLLNDSITKIIEKYDADSIDFIAIRSNVNYGPNCFFIVQRDSCSFMYILELGEENLIGYIHVGNITSRRPKDGGRPCENNLAETYFSLTDYHDYFTNDQPDYSMYDESKIVIMGSVHDRYLYEIVDRNYFSEHHSGYLYATFSSFF